MERRGNPVFLPAAPDFAFARSGLQARGPAAKSASRLGKRASAVEAMAGATYRGTPIPGTSIFTGARSRQGYRVNKFAMSLTDAANREAFRADERAYMRKYGLTEAEMDLVARRDWKGLVEAGGNIYVLIKVGGAVGQNLLEMGAQMRGQSLAELMQSRPGHRGTAVIRSR
jgi:protocatechuate 4,5-dioxygenase alpha chain